MRIVLVTSDLLPDPGGIATHVSNLARVLSRRGNSVAIVHNPKTRESNPAEYIAHLDSDVVYELIPPSKVRLRPFSTVQRIANTRRSIGRAFSRLPEGKGREGDVVHFHDIMNTTLVSALIRERRVWTNHSSQFYDLSGLRLLVARAFTRVHARIAPSTELAQLTRLKLRRTAVYIPNGVDVESVESADASHELPRDPSEFRIFAPRRMVHKNGIDVLTEAMTLVGPPVLHRRWVVALPETGASDSYLRKVQQLALRAPDWVEILLIGPVESPDMDRWYRWADIAVVPSRIEAVSISALETMAYGLPLIASKVGGLRDAFEDCAHVDLVAAEDPVALGAALERLESLDQDELLKVGKASIQWVRENYSWETVAEQTVEVYRQAGRAT